MIDDYEENVIQPPPEFRDDYKPKPMPRTIKTAPLPLPRTKIEEVAKAMKGYTKSFEIGIKNNKDPLLQLQNTRKAVENHIIKELSAMKGVKFIETLKVKFTKMSGDSVIYKTAYFNSKAQTIINNLEIVESLQASKQQILNFVAQWISEGSGWTIESVDGHYINLVKYEPMKGESYIQLPPELRNSAKGLINMKNEDNECFRWCHIRYINPQDKYPQRIKKSDKAYIERLDYSKIEFPVTIKQYNKIEKQNEININVFGYENKQPYPIYISKENFQFMSSSLEKLVSNLPKESLKYTSEIFESKQLNLMSRKGIYPYDYMDSFDKFNEKLPKKEDFYSILNDEHISDDDYKHAKNVWKTFKIKNMGEYHDLYLKSDVLLLADVFESFRKTCLEYYKLDPCHYFTSPGLSWDAMLKMTDIKLELMTDVDMYQFIEKGMRGGISYIAHRYGKANNKYMKKYDEKAPSKYIMYLDANNLYGYAMSQYLPTGCFRWLTQKQIDETNLAKYKEDSKKGLILEVDLEYPKELHNHHNDYPLGAEKVKAEDVYKDFFNDKEKFDNSDYPEKSPFFDKTNNKVIGKFKDEASFIPILEFIGLRSKMYSYIKDNLQVGKTAKGIKKSVIKKDVTHENYKETLFNKTQMHHTMKTIRSQGHQLESYEINKISLSCFDDKRFVEDILAFLGAQCPWLYFMTWQLCARCDLCVGEDEDPEGCSWHHVHSCVHPDCAHFIPLDSQPLRCDKTYKLNSLLTEDKLQPWIKHFNCRNQDTDQLQFKPGRVSRGDLLLIARDVGKQWDVLGRILLDEKELEHIDYDQQSLYDKCFVMLTRWTEAQGSSATYAALGKALMQTLHTKDLCSKYCLASQGVLESSV
ncbi:hypothetical protein ACROYT_G022337 [Oculina patagonica]